MPWKPVSESRLTSIATVGTRVVLRVRLPDPELEPGGPHHTDVIGDVVSIDDTTVVVRGRRGEVTVPRARIVLAKSVPPPPVRRPRRPPADPPFGR
ncbi:acetyltransferase [Flexivirga oryzae]|uniref:Histone acetyltransferase Rv0428c-like SH3 domain-containing protein n=1 Tax=Flexivirga oryzae TaxID=1794944 RepID=A0A839NDN2_9MICO|nr:acetyltransferase [Flexivirga oryzae]MBB2894433.1 hypothetical protein [Flexivirga oryzae]